MASEMGFTNATVSLRSPRVTVAIPADEHWAFYARRSLEFLALTWGGAQGTVLPLTDKGANPAVLRLIQKYDPDYLIPLMASLTDLEYLRPGERSLLLDSRTIPDEERQEFIRQAEERRPHLTPLLSDRILEEARGLLNTFRDVDKRPRVNVAHPLQEPDSTISRSGPVPDAANVSTGNELLDLSVGIQIGICPKPSATKTVAQTALSRHDIMSIVIPGSRARDRIDLDTPSEATTVGLGQVSMGLRSDQGPLVVLGRSADDFALAMAWGHFAGSVIWLPLTGSQTTWLKYAGTALDIARPLSHPLRITSASLTRERCNKLIESIWGARMAYSVDDAPAPWLYVDPMELEVSGRTDLRLADRWDQRFALPTVCDRDGGFGMVTRFPLVTPAGDEPGGRWVVDVIADSNPIHSFNGFAGDDLFADGQHLGETFVRANGSGISFEAGRFDFVDAGASPYGQLAQPRLRWPSLNEMLNSAARRSGYGIRASAPGHLGRLAAELFGGRDKLTVDLFGVGREVLDQFLPAVTKNGPLKDGKGIGLRGSRFFTFSDLASRVRSLNEIELRTWLDHHVGQGSIRVGHILNCKSCQWVDYYVMEDVGTTFTCKRCSSDSHLSIERWREPVAGANWYYDLHPNATRFLRDHGDVPLLAVRTLKTAGLRAKLVEFEFELVKAKERPIAEIDFAFMSRGNLVIGEAKSSSKLDGGNRVERLRDARKLITAGEMLGASEVCYATATAWKQSAKDAILAAKAEASSHMTVSVVENVATPSPRSRTVL